MYLEGIRTHPYKKNDWNEAKVIYFYSINKHFKKNHLPPSF